MLSVFIFSAVIKRKCQDATNYCRFLPLGKELMFLFVFSLSIYHSIILDTIRNLKLW